MTRIFARRWIKRKLQFTLRRRLSSTTKGRRNCRTHESSRLRAVLLRLKQRYRRLKLAFKPRIQLVNVRSGLTGTQADVQRTALERKRQESLVAAESATRQKLEQAVADEERFQAQRTSRLAEIDSAGAQLASRQADFQRARAHLDKSRAELEAQRRQRAVLDSQEQTLLADLKSRQAALEFARTNLGYTRIVAPEDGIVGERKVRAGQFVSPGTQIVSLVEKQIWVQANYRETQLLRIRPGDRLRFAWTRFLILVLKGHVEEIAPASGSQFALLPPDNATGNFTKVTQRVPVKIVSDDHQNGIGTIAAGALGGRLRSKPKTDPDDRLDTTYGCEDLVAG